MKTIAIHFDEENSNLTFVFEVFLILIQLILSNNAFSTKPRATQVAKNFISSNSWATLTQVNAHQTQKLIIVGIRAKNSVELRMF